MNRKEKHLHVGPNVKIPELIYSFFFFFFPLTSMHLIQISLPRSAGGKLSVELRQ